MNKGECNHGFGAMTKLDAKEVSNDLSIINVKGDRAQNMDKFYDNVASMLFVSTLGQVALPLINGLWHAFRFWCYLVPQNTH